MIAAVLAYRHASDVRLCSFPEVLLPGPAVIGKGDVTRPLVYGQLELKVLGELLAAPEVHAARGGVSGVPERLLKLPVVHPVAQCPRVRALLRGAARVLTGASGALLVSLGSVVGAVALLKD